MPSTATPAPQHAVGDELHGFRLHRIEALDELRARAYEAEHLASGARIVHLHSADSEKLFAIGLPTPPSDDTGVAHILEHTVLCGSRRFPVKDPFVELLKASLATFLNAMTYPDRTVYPVASLNRRDFFNLVDVYCDAVFHPLLREDHFRQEGHRLGFTTTGDPASELCIKGIVYNEMKGVFSDYDGTFFRSLKAGLLPDNAYGCESGGSPEAIPDLDYAAFCAFHRDWYHPSNALIFAYGDVAPAELCAFLDQRLAGFTRLAVDTSIAEQARWAQPRRDEVAYPIGPTEDPSDRHAVSLAWLCCPITATEEWLGMQVVEGYLLDNDASPLRRALIASGLGRGLAPSGYVDVVRDTIFTVGLRGCGPDAAADLETLVDECLAREAEVPDVARLAAALHQLEIDLADVSERFPLQLMGRAYRRWMYGCDPLAALDLAGQFAAMRARLADPTWFGGLLRRQLLDNPHRLTLSFRPDPELGSRRAAAERARIDALGAGLDDPARAELAREDARLEAAQSQPNSAEALATLPRLSRSDVPPSGLEPAVTSERHGSAELVTSEVLTGGVSHWQLAFDLSALPDELVEWLPLFTNALARLGAGGLGWEELAQRQDAVMAGVGAGVSTATRADDPSQFRWMLTLGSQALHRHVPEMAAFLRLRALELDLDDHDRLRELIAEQAVHLRSGVVGNGSGYAGRAAKRHLRRQAALDERSSGFHQIHFFEGLHQHLDDRFDEALAALTRIRDHLRSHSALTLSAVGPDSTRATAAEFVAEFAQRPALGSLPGAMAAPAVRPVEGVATAAEVAFVTCAADVGVLEPAAAAALHLLAAQLRVGYLWEEIRVKGGAYGARTGYDRHTGLFTVASYRDPHILRSLDTFAGVAAHVSERMDLDAASLEQAIIGSMKTLDRPLRPGGVCGQSLWRHLRGSTAASRQAHREALLALTADQVRRAARETLGPAVAAAPVCVVAGRSALEQAATERPDLGLVISDL